MTMRRRIRFNKNTVRREEEKPFNKDIVRLTFNTNLSEAQEAVGMVGKVTILHPAFSTRATIYEKEDGTLRIQPSSKALDSGKEKWFNIVYLTLTFRNYVIDEFKKFASGEGDNTPWYLKAHGKTEVEVTGEKANESLDIEEIQVADRLTDSQLNAGIVAKATVVTSIATLRSYTIFLSNYGDSLYGREQCEDDDNTIPAYMLSQEAEAQVLSFIHSGIEEWGAPEEVEEPINEDEEKELAKTANNKETPKVNTDKPVNRSRRGMYAGK